MKKKAIRKLSLILALLAVAAMLAGCSGATSSAGTASPTAASVAASASANASATAASASASAPASSSAPASTYTGAVKTIKIGIGNAFKPMCYLDENGNLQGYDYETLKKINELLPQYKFVFEATEFKNILVGLDTHAYDIAVHHFGWNASRADKYLYGNVGDFYLTGYNLVIAKGSKVNVKSVEDLGGLKIAVGTSSNVAYLSETFNKSHPNNPIKLVYDDGTQEQQLTNLKNNVYDGFFSDPWGVTLLKASYGDVFDVTGSQLFFDPSAKNACYFIFSKGDEKLRDDIDGALQKLLDNGWEKELSLKILGSDFTVDLSKTEQKKG